MASLPTDLTRKWWSDNKAITLKSTKLGEVLGAWETALADTKKVETRRNAAYDKATAALKDVLAKVAEAKSACNTTLHKDTIKILEAYPALVTKASNALMLHREEYSKFGKNWGDIRKRAKAFMTTSETEMKELAKKADGVTKLCKATASNTKIEATKLVTLKNAAAAEGKKVLAELTAKQKKIDDTFAEAREPLDRHVSPHVDDRPADALNLFDECRKIQLSIIATRKNAEDALGLAVKECGG